MKLAILSMVTLLAAPIAFANDVSTSMNTLGWQVFEQLASDKKGQNIIYSPLSTGQTLHMAYQGASGDNKIEMGQVLGLDGADEASLLQANADYLKTLNSIPEVNKEMQDGTYQLLPAYEMNLANAIWNQEGVSEVNPTFRQKTEGFYDGKISAIPFGKLGADIINEWAAAQTDDKISQIVSEDSLNADQRMVLTNAVRIKAQWSKSFDPQFTADADFTTSDNQSLMVPTMVEKQTVQFDDQLDYQGISLATEGRTEDGRARVQFFAIMPSTDAPEDFLAANSIEDVIESISNRNSENVILHMPKFKIEPEAPMELSAPLKQLGMTSAFSPKMGMFDDLLVSNELLYISSILQKAYISVEEGGFEAAAVTAIVFGTTSVIIDQPITVKLNKPFIYVIRDMELGSNLFVGILNNPL